MKISKTKLRKAVNSLLDALDSRGIHSSKELYERAGDIYSSKGHAGQIRLDLTNHNIRAMRMSYALKNFKPLEVLLHRDSKYTTIKFRCDTRIPGYELDGSRRRCGPRYVGKPKKKMVVCDKYNNFKQKVTLNTTYLPTIRKALGYLERVLKSKK